MTIEDDVLTKMKARPYAGVRRLVRDGDLLLCSAHDPFSKVIRWATRSPWSHIAIAYRIESLNRVMVLESVEKLGVRTVPLSTFIAKTSDGTHPYPGSILLARHAGIGALGEARAHKMYDFAFSRLGDRFAPGEIVKIATRIVMGRFERHMPKHLGPKNEYICSEYVARCFAAAGVKIPWDGLGFVAPADFARDPEVKAIAQISTR